MTLPKTVSMQEQSDTFKKRFDDLFYKAITTSTQAGIITTDDGLILAEYQDMLRAVAVGAWKLTADYYPSIPISHFQAFAEAFKDSLEEEINCQACLPDEPGLKTAKSMFSQFQEDLIDTYIEGA